MGLGSPRALVEPQERQEPICPPAATWRSRRRLFALLPVISYAPHLLALGYSASDVIESGLAGAAVDNALRAAVRAGARSAPANEIGAQSPLVMCPAASWSYPMADQEGRKRG
jgi:hypothetical protein